MNSKHKPIPQFNSEDEEREFWATHDSSEYLDWNKAERNPTFSRLKPSTRTVSIRLPESMIAALKTLANKRDVPYQSLVKIFLAEKIKEETSMQHNPRELKIVSIHSTCGGCTVIDNLISDTYNAKDDIDAFLYNLNL